MYNSEFTEQTSDISLQGWAKGLYFVHIIKNSEIIDVKKIILE